MLFNINNYAQISPGKLSAAHADLEGMSKCTSCHVLGKKVEVSKCLKCHTEIAEAINFRRGFHANKEVTNQKCWKCHGEHFGRKFQIIRFDEKKFDHNKAGFELKGSHKKLECGKCHNKKLIKNEKLKRKQKTFLGLETNCADCHEDVHQKTLGNKCSNCHNEEKFKPAVKFNHSKTKFKLTGSHKKVKCVNCHKITKKEGKKFQKFTNVKFRSCNSCHKDPHKGKFGKRCSSCHNTVSFKKVNNLKGFNHSKTNFPLIGKHRKVKCETCHKGGLSYKPKYQHCYNCHSDYHKGAFKLQNGIKDCKICHNERGFSPSVFTLGMHNNTKFKLENAHAATPCIACHKKEDKWHFRIDGSRCIVCHSNIHESKISRKFFDENKCQSCHSTLSWNTVKFDHHLTGFDLLGAHKKVACSDCHIKKSADGKLEQHFTDLTGNCSQCHNDIHMGQFNSGDKENCNTCHTFDNWKPVLFNHSKTRFILDGAHKKVECNKCHHIKEKNGIEFIQYKIEDVRCISCHS